jgi:hypothetical protein
MNWLHGTGTILIEDIQPPQPRIAADSGFAAPGMRAALVKEPKETSKELPFSGSFKAEKTKRLEGTQTTFL